MSIITSSGLRASVSAVAAVALTSLLAWGFASSTADIQWLGSDAVASCVCPPSVPVCVCGRSPRIRMRTRRALGPRDEEIRRNPRARSARLRAAEKVTPDAP